MSTKAFECFSGELGLANAALSSTEWEGVMRRLMNEAPQLNVRALKLDDNDLGGERIEAVIGEMIPRLELLTEKRPPQKRAKNARGARRCPPAHSNRRSGEAVQHAVAQASAASA